MPKTRGCSANPTTACARSSTVCRWSTTARRTRCPTIPPRSTAWPGSTVCPTARRSSPSCASCAAGLPNATTACLAKASARPPRCRPRSTRRCAVNLFRLFAQRRGLLAQGLRVLTLAGPLADELARRPELLDRLIDSSALDLPGSVESLAACMRRGEAGDDYEQRLDRIRQVVGEERFALGVQIGRASW